MKNFANLLFGFLLLTSLRFILTLDIDSFYPIKTIEIKGNAAADEVGWSVSSAGDIDNDGYYDIIIAAPYKNSSQGVVYVIYGGETTDLNDIDLSSLALDAQQTGFTIKGNAAQNGFGYSVSSAGDIDNDGYADIIVGAPYRNSYMGAAYIIYGRERSSMTDLDLSSEDLSPTSTGFMVTGNAASDNLGWSVSSAGDIDNDGYDDIIIGAREKSSAQGAAYIIYGGDKSTRQHLVLSSGTLNPTSTGFMATGSATGTYFGQSVSSAGDVNGDGYDDIIIGAYGSKGAVYVIYGGAKASMSNVVLSSTTLNPMTTGFMVTGSTNGIFFGWSVSSAGDIDNDGYDDIIFGAFGANSQQGAAYVVYGGSGSSLSNIAFSSSGSTLDPATTGFTITGNAQEDYFGRSVSSAGDINQDGYDDIIIGANYKNSQKGAAYVIYGGAKSSMSNIALETTTTLGSLGFMVEGESAGDSFGFSVSKAGDVNNDSIPDLLIGAYGVSSYTGAAYLILNQCPNNCETCSSSTSCEACLSPYLLYLEQCLDSCPTKTYESNGVECKDCPTECSVCTDQSTCQNCIAGYTLSDSECKIVETETEEVEKIEENAAMKTATGVFEGTSLAGSALGSGSSLPLNFGIVAKILRNIKYMDLLVSTDLYETFVSWKVASGFMSAPSSWSGKYSSKTIPTVFSRYELQAAFMINFWKPLSMALIGVAVFAIFKLIEVNPFPWQIFLIFTDLHHKSGVLLTFKTYFK